MNMFGSCEYSAPYTFRSIPHFMYYLLKIKKAFGPHYRLNLPFWYLRPKSEFRDLELISSYDKFSIISLQNSYKYSSKLKFIENMTYSDFLDNYS